MATGNWHAYEPIVGDTHEISYTTIVKRNHTNQESRLHVIFGVFNTIYVREYGYGMLISSS